MSGWITRAEGPENAYGESERLGLAIVMHKHRPTFQANRANDSLNIMMTTKKGSPVVKWLWK